MFDLNFSFQFDSFVCMWKGAGVTCGPCEGVRGPFGGIRFFLSTVWVHRIKLRSPGLVAVP